MFTSRRAPGPCPDGGPCELHRQAPEPGQPWVPMGLHGSTAAALDEVLAPVAPPPPRTVYCVHPLATASPPDWYAVVDDDGALRAVPAADSEAVADLWAAADAWASHLLGRCVGVDPRSVAAVATACARAAAGRVPPVAAALAEAAVGAVEAWIRGEAEPAAARRAGEAAEAVAAVLSDADGGRSAVYAAVYAAACAGAATDADSLDLTAAAAARCAAMALSPTLPSYGDAERALAPLVRERLSLGDLFHARTRP